jgi:hypothetical protein
MKAPDASSSLRRLEADLFAGFRRDSNLTLDGDLKVQSSEKLQMVVALTGSKRRRALTNSTRLFRSIAKNRIDKVIDCQNTNLTELTLNSGLQFTIADGGAFTRRSCARDCGQPAS